MSKYVIGILAFIPLESDSVPIPIPLGFRTQISPISDHIWLFSNGIHLAFDICNLALQILWFPDPNPWTIFFGFRV